MWKYLLWLVVLTLPHQAFAWDPNPRQNKPISVLGEVSLGGPNGTFALNTSFETTDWLSITVGGGYSIFTDAYLSSCQLNTRILRSTDLRNGENSLMLSAGAGYRSASRRIQKGWWNEEDITITSDYSLWFNTAAAWAYAGHSGMRLRLYMALEYPMHIENHLRIDESGNSSKPTTSPVGYTSVGLQVGAAF